MSLDNLQKFLIFELEYKISKKRTIKIFGKNFVDKNRDKCKIIYNGKEYKLTEFFKFNRKYNDNNIQKIKLKINNNISDISYMFYECKSLISIRDISTLDFNIANLNRTISEFNSYNSCEKYYNSIETEKGENIYDDNLLLSTINNIQIDSIFTGTNYSIRRYYILFKL